jgi:multidrug efflux pump
VDCINRMRKKGMNIVNAIVAAGQQRLRPIISTTLSTIGGIITLTITDKLWEGLGVVIIFGIAFATVLTLVVVPVMYSLFEGLGYYIISAIRGPRWQEAPTGQSFFFSRRGYARIWLFLIGLIQIASLGAGVYYLMPMLMTIIDSTAFQAPTTLKLAIQIIVFVLSLFLRGIGVLLVLLLPGWIGLVVLMGRRTADSLYVDVNPDGVTITSPAERLFVPGEEITKVGYSRLTRRLTIRAGRRRIKVRGVVKTTKDPTKVSFWRWLSAPAPTRSDLRNGMDSLETAVEHFVLQNP